VVYAVELREFTTFGGRHFVDGTGGFFHPGCPPGPVGYVERDRPDTRP
jgi:hypothetical protein